MIKIPSDYVVTYIRKVVLALRKESECEPLSIPGNLRLLLPMSSVTFSHDISSLNVCTVVLDQIKTLRPPHSGMMQSAMIC